MINRVCVYCGSGAGRRSEYTDQVIKLGELLAQKNIELVYGGASIGVMGRIADTVLTNGGRVTGVIPEDLVNREVAHNGLSERHVVATMHERKARMAELADGFIALPGGLGTIEELFEVLTWRQLGYHHKPIGLFNVCGYFDQLSAFLDHAVTEQFIKPEYRSMLVVEEEPQTLLARLKQEESVAK